MFDRFEDDCKQAMNEARKEAQRLGHDFLEAEHMLLGLLHVPRCTAVRMLQELGSDAESIRSRAEAFLPAGQVQGPPRMLPFTERGKLILELAMKQALTLADAHIGTEHVLLGYAQLAEQGGEPAEILGVDLERLRSVLDQVPRGEKAPTASSRKNPLDDPRMFAPPAQRVRLAADIREQVKLDLIFEQRFEQASRARDIAHWLRQLADEIAGDPPN